MQTMIVEGPKFSVLTTWMERDRQLVCVSAPESVGFMMNCDLDSAKDELTKRGFNWQWRNPRN